MAARNDDIEIRQPLSFWATVGANLTGGIIMGAVSTVITVLAYGGVARRVGALEAAAAPAQPLPDNNAGV